ncbi:MAG: PAS domain S-box protein [Candidatus Heimdallarchaeota archaeon]|nr:PAS domain S-box protein [Candidatus Heimdallarchaeota archaeon]
MIDIKILFMTTDDSIVEIIKSHLEGNKLCWEIETCTSAKVALQKLKDDSFDIVISEYQLEDSDGLSFFSAMRKVANKVPFILFTAKSNEKIAIKAVNLGIDFYLKREGKLEEQIEELIQTIENLSDRRKQWGTQSHPKEKTKAINSTQIQILKKLTAKELSSELLFEIMNEVLIVTDQDFYITELYGRYIEIFNFTKGEMIGKPLLDFVHEDYKEFMTIQMNKMKKEPVDKFEIGYKNKEERMIHTLFSPKAFFNEQSQLLGIVGFLTDITVYKDIEKNLQKNEKQYQELFQQSKDAIYISTRSGKFIDINQAGLELFGFTKEEIYSIDIAELYVNQKDRETFQAIIEQKGQVKDYEVQLRKKDGQEIYCLITASIKKDLSGEILGYQGIIRNITERKRMQEALERQRDELEAFASIVAHDIRAKLQIISLHNLKLKGEASDKISNKIEEISTFLQNLLLMAKKGEILGETTEVNLNELLEDIIKKYQPFKSNTTILLEELPELKGNKMRLRQLFENILLNSFRHAKASQIVISVQEHEEGYSILIQDDGIGISEKQIDEIHYSWKKGDYNNLGLMIVKKIIDAHGGEVEISSKIDQGTTIKLFFPREPS